MCTAFTFDSDFAVARLLPDGTLDLAHGGEVGIGARSPTGAAVHAPPSQLLPPASGNMGADCGRQPAIFRVATTRANLSESSVLSASVTTDSAPRQPAADAPARALKLSVHAASMSSQPGAKSVARWVHDGQAGPGQQLAAAA